MNQVRPWRWLYLLPFFITWIAASLINYSQYYDYFSLVDCGIACALAVIGYSLLIHIPEILGVASYFGEFILLFVLFILAVKGGTVLLLWKGLTKGGWIYFINVSLLMPVWLIEAIWLGDWILKL